MVDKRLFKKLPLIKKEMEPPVLYGDNKPGSNNSRVGVQIME